jgi:uncharacterized membrane protein
MPTKKANAKAGAKTGAATKISGSFDARDVEDNKIIASLSYIFILCLVPLLLQKKSAYAQFHARQGLTITVAWFALWVFGIIPILGWIVAFFGNIILLVISIAGVIKTLNGEAWEIPFIYEWSKKWNL